MRVPSRFKPKALLKPQPGPFLSIRFVSCLRCMAHGQFQTHPPERRVTASLSKVGAIIHLEAFRKDGLISANQYEAVKVQILNSNLPDEIPQEVRDFVRNFCAVDGKAEQLASLGEGSVTVDLEATDIAEAVHEFLLTAPGHANLRIQ